MLDKQARMYVIQGGGMQTGEKKTKTCCLWSLNDQQVGLNVPYESTSAAQDGILNRLNSAGNTDISLPLLSAFKCTQTYSSLDENAWSQKCKISLTSLIIITLCVILLKKPDRQILH